MTILLLTMLIAVGAELVTLTSAHAVAVSSRQHTLAHDLAVDSALLLLADRLADVQGTSSDLIRELDLFGRTSLAFDVGQVTVRCVIQDDGSKFNPLLFQSPDQADKPQRKLAMLAAMVGLPPAGVELRPVLASGPQARGPLYRWYDQLLSGAQPGALFRWNEGGEARGKQPVWSDAVTLWGDGRIDLRRVSSAVLEAALEDIRPGLAGGMLSARLPDRSVDFTPAALIRVPAETRERMAARITFNTRRYAIRLDTSTGADRRRWYVVANIGDGKVSILHRSRLTW